MIHYGWRGLNELIEKGESREVAWCLGRRFESPTNNYFFLRRVKTFTHFEQKSKIIKFVLRNISESRYKGRLDTNIVLSHIIICS